MKPLALTAVDEQILLALGQYRLLTIAQIERLGISGRKHIGERLGLLVRANYIARARSSAINPGVHWLTPKAATHFGPVFGEEWARAASSKGFTDNLHMPQRLATIDVCLAIRDWVGRAGWKLGGLRTDFDARGGNLKRATTLEWGGLSYVPDALGEVIDPAGVPWAFAVEVETGGLSERLDNFKALLPARMEVMNKRVIDYAMGRQGGGKLAAARMLFVFGSAAMLERAINTLPDREARTWRAVFFKALPDVVEDFGGAWLQATGERRNPFERVE